MRQHLLTVEITHNLKRRTVDIKEPATAHRAAKMAGASWADHSKAAKELLQRYVHLHT